MIKKFALILISLIVFFTSCEPPVEESPSDLLDEAKFKDITIKLHLLESYVESKYDNKDTAKAYFDLLEKKMFIKNNMK